MHLQNAVKDKIGSMGKGGSANDEKTTLLAERDNIRAQQSGLKGSRTAIFEEMNTLKAENDKKVCCSQRRLYACD